MVMPHLLRLIALPFLVLSAAPFAQATVTVPEIFESNMVLQREKPIPVHGFAAAGESVTVTLSGSAAVATVADANGDWRVDLPARPATTTAQTLTIKGPSNTITLTNVLIGEVFLFSGQSNLVRPLSDSLETGALRSMSGDIVPNLRIWSSAWALPTGFFDDAVAWPPPRTMEMLRHWSAPTWSVASSYSSFCIFFGQKMRALLGPNVPIGLVRSSRGGTQIKAWVPRPALERNPLGRSLIADYEAAFPPGTPRDDTQPGVLYNNLTAPIAPFALRGIVWYQAEGNVYADPEDYATLLPMLAESYREAFEAPRLPFVAIQIANYQTPSATYSSNQKVAAMREIQAWAISKIPYSDYVTIHDTGPDWHQIHPLHKRPAGERAAVMMYNRFMGGTASIWRGPRVIQSTFSGGTATVVFDHVGTGLMIGQWDTSNIQNITVGAAPGGTALRGFTLQASNGSWYRANATIAPQGDRVIVTHPSVTTATAVRYGWEDNLYFTGAKAQGTDDVSNVATPGFNLYNSAGYPASPWRSDISTATNYPLDLTASYVSNGIQLSWAASPTSSGRLGYNVYRANSATGSLTLLTSSPQAGRTYLDTLALTPTERRHYVVTAVYSTDPIERNVTLEAVTRGGAAAFADWAAIQRLTSNSALPEADSFGLGVPNLVAFALGHDPDAGITATRPSLEVATDRLRFKFTRSRPELHYDIEASSNLIDWSVISTDPGTVGSEVSVDDPQLLSDNPKRFLRLKIR